MRDYLQLKKCLGAYLPEVLPVGICEDCFGCDEGLDCPFLDELLYLGELLDGSWDFIEKFNNFDNFLEFMREGIVKEAELSGALKWDSHDGFKFHPEGSYLAWFSDDYLVGGMRMEANLKMSYRIWCEYIFSFSMNSVLNILYCSDFILAWWLVENSYKKRVRPFYRALMLLNRNLTSYFISAYSTMRLLSLDIYKIIIYAQLKPEKTICYVVLIRTLL